MSWLSAFIRFVRPGYPASSSGRRPRIIRCRAFEDIPTASELKRLCTRRRHVLVKIPRPSKSSESNRAAWVRSLAAQLPDHTVFESIGPSESEIWITIIDTIRRQTVMQNLDAALNAIEDFAATASDLMERLADSLGCRADKMMETRNGLDHSRWQGKLDREWHYWFHGDECRFNNHRTGQTVDVSLEGYRHLPTLLDPYFFGVFVQTTPAHRQVAELLSDTYHDTARLLETLIEGGYLPAGTAE